MDVLVRLVESAGRVVSKDALVEDAWQGLAVTDNTIVQTVRRLRQTLGEQPDGRSYLETSVRQGYRFVASVERGLMAPSGDGGRAALAPYLAFADGSAALETLGRDAVDHARQAFEAILRADPFYGSAYVGMADACVLSFESTRVDRTPDVQALEVAEGCVREACRIQPALAETWSTLAIVRHCRGDAREAAAAARKAIRLEPDNWRHHLRMAFVGWGEERLRAAQRVLALQPGLALAHWLAATVFVARGVFGGALDVLRAGCALQDAQRGRGGRFTAIGLHLLHGLVLAAGGAVDSALAEFERELAFEDSGHVYAREAAANSACAIGALRLRLGQHDAARDAFDGALARVPGHALAVVGLAALSSKPRSVPCVDVTDGVEAAIASAASLVLEGKHDAAARVCGEALVQAAPGAAGWLLPVEPLLRAAEYPEHWTETLATLRDRAV